MNETTVFHLRKSNFWLGFGFAIAAAILGVLALLNVPPHFACWLSFGVICFIFSLMAFIPYWVIRVRVDHRGIEYRGLRKKTYMRWQDAEQVYVILERQSAVIYGNGNRIAVGTIFDGFNRMLKLIEQYVPINIGDDAALEQKEIGDAMGKTFRKSKFLVIFGSILLAFALVLVLINYKPENPIEKVLSSVSFAALGIYFLQSYYFNKVYIDSNRIVRWSLFYDKVEIKWLDIQSVTVRYGSKMQTLTILSYDDMELRVTSEFKEFYDIKQFINKFSPAKPTDEDDESF